MAYLKIGEEAPSDWHSTGSDFVGRRGESAQEHVFKMFRSGCCRLLVGELVPGGLRGAVGRVIGGGGVGIDHGAWTGVYAGRHG